MSMYNPIFDLIPRLIGEEGAGLLRDQPALGGPAGAMTRGLPAALNSNDLWGLLHMLSAIRPTCSFLIFNRATLC